MIEENWDDITLYFVNATFEKDGNLFEKNKAFILYSETDENYLESYLQLFYRATLSMCSVDAVEEGLLLREDTDAHDKCCYYISFISKENNRFNRLIIVSKSKQHEIKDILFRTLANIKEITSIEESRDIVLLSAFHL